MKITIRNSLGILLVAIGILIVLQNLDLLQGNTGNIVWASLFIIASSYLIYKFYRNRRQWWLVIIGLVGLFLAASNIISLFPALAMYSNLVSIIGIGFGFLLIYLIGKENWWALIPVGLLFSIGVGEILEISQAGVITDGIIFWGLGFTFLIMLFLPTQTKRMNWPAIPAAVLLAIGAVVTLDKGGRFFSILGPGLLLFGGGLILYLSTRSTK